MMACGAVGGVSMRGRGPRRPQDEAVLTEEASGEAGGKNGLP